MGCSSSKKASDPVQAPTASAAASAPATPASEKIVANKKEATQIATKPQELLSAVPSTSTSTAPETEQPTTTTPTPVTQSESSSADVQLLLTAADRTLLLSSPDSTRLLSASDRSLLLAGDPIPVEHASSNPADAAVVAQRLRVSFAVPESVVVNDNATSANNGQEQSSSDEVEEQQEEQQEEEQQQQQGQQEQVSGTTGNGDNGISEAQQLVDGEATEGPTSGDPKHSTLDDVKERVEAIEGAVIDAVKVGAEHVTQGVSDGLEKTSTWLLPRSPTKAQNSSTKANHDSFGLSRKSRTYSQSHDDLLIQISPKRNNNDRRKSTQSAGNRDAASISSSEPKPEVLMSPIAFMKAVFTPKKAPWWSAEADREREREAQRAAATKEKVVEEVEAMVDAYVDASKIEVETPAKKSEAWDGGKGVWSNEKVWGEPQADQNGSVASSGGNSMADDEKEQENNSAVVEL